MRKRLTGSAAAVALLCGSTAVLASTSTGPSRILEVNVTNTSHCRAGEPEIAVNPTNHNNLIYVSTCYKLRPTPVPGVGVPPLIEEFGGNYLFGAGDLACSLSVSDNGGATWTKLDWPLGDLEGCGDPMAAVSRDGTFYVAFDWQGSRYSSNVPPYDNPVAVARSTDGGHTWSDPVSTGTPVDRPFLRLDPTTGWLYEVSGIGGRVLSISKDRGQTWTVVHPPLATFNSTPVQGPGTAFPGNHIAVNHGVMGTAVQDGSTSEFGGLLTAPTGSSQLMFDVSTDGGQSFRSLPVTNSRGASVTGGSGDYVSADSARAGRFAVMQVNGSNLEVYVTRDSGKHWTGPAVIAAPGANKQWFDFGPNNEVAVMWKSTNKEGLIDVHSVLSRDGGTTFSSPVRVNGRSFAPEPAQNGAGDDLSWIVLDSTYSYVAWGDTRTGTVNGYFARVPLARYR
jgi:hypothetical protein